MLLNLTLGELAWVFSFFHSDKSILEGRDVGLFVIGTVALTIGVVQMIITRRVDYYVVKPPLGETETK